MKQFPRVLICSISRINAYDNGSNNLLLRNLFADWPRDHLAQIYSGGSNGDEGFCGMDYQIGAIDRRFGSLFMRLKSDYNHSYNPNSTFVDSNQPLRKENPLRRIVSKVGSFLMDSGLYELIFRLRISSDLLHWVKEYNPDIIFAQGYSLSFIKLPLKLKEHFRKPITFFTSDDWPTYLYAKKGGMLSLTAPYMHRLITSSTKRLLQETDIPFSFNDMMGEEYERRYGKKFITIMHSDNPSRFEVTEENRLQPPNVYSIVTVGSFFKHRWPLLIDIEDALYRLNDEGIPVRLTVLTSMITKEGIERINRCTYIELRDDPGHDALPSYLKAADLLLLPEVFDEDEAYGYRFSVSTKAHLFMLSRKPILVYGHSQTGVVKYAQNAGWAKVVDKRDIDLLTLELRNLLLDNDLRQELLMTANSIASENHNCNRIRSIFKSVLCGEGENV